MKKSKSIFMAFILNLFFSIFEFIGGFFTISISIISDSIHDIGDALGIGIAALLEKKSKKQPDNKYTYGYGGYSVISSVIITLILLAGSFIVIYNAISRIINPVEINYNGMLMFAIVGVIINSIAAYITHKGNSLNEKAVSLHMLEDVLSWVIVLIGAVVMKFTNFVIIDPILSIILAIYIILHAFYHLKEALDLFLEKVPSDIDVEEVTNKLLKIEGIRDVHHVHIWSIDGIHNYATLHVVANIYTIELKKQVKEQLTHLGIEHTTIEFEQEDEHCENVFCDIKNDDMHSHHHHH